MSPPYYELQQRERDRETSPYSGFRNPRLASEYDMGIGVLGQANTYTGEIKILKTLSPEQKRKVNEHEQEHLRDPSAPEELVRDRTQTWAV
tara:strand:- start:120 stop:392 length:273 start_codon:yes stop_codon:yes gene_type:complete